MLSCDNLRVGCTLVPSIQEGPSDTHPEVHFTNLLAHFLFSFLSFSYFYFTVETGSNYVVLVAVEITM